MPTIKELYKGHEELLDKYLNHPGYKEDDPTCAVTRAADRHVSMMGILEKKAAECGWDHWMLPIGGN